MQLKQNIGYWNCTRFWP